MKFNVSLLIVFSLFILSMSLVSAGNINITSPSNNTLFNTSAIFINYSLINNNSINNYTCKNLGVDINCSGLNFPIVGAVEGNNIVYFYTYTYNTIGDNIDITNTSLSFGVDTLLPNINILYQGNMFDNIGYYNITNIDINYTISDINSKACWYTLDGNTIYNNTYNNNTRLLSTAGQHNYTLNANDTLGHIQSKSITFIVDLISPKLNQTNITDITSTSARIYFYSNEWINVLINYSSNISELNDESYANGYSGYKTLSHLNSNTTYYFNITICDRAGNCLTNGTYSFITLNGSASLTIVATSNISANISCSTTYTYGEWNECRSDGTQIRAYIKSNPNCFNPIPIVQQSCNYIDLKLTVGDINNSTDTALDDKKGLSLFWWIVIIIGILCLLVYLFYVICGSTEPEDNTEYDPMGGYGINDYYDE